MTEEGVSKLLRKLNPHKASGPDFIPARILKDMADEISPLLTIIFQRSFDLTVEKYQMIGGQLTSHRFSRKVTNLKPVITVPCHSPACAVRFKSTL